MHISLQCVPYADALCDLPVLSFATRACERVRVRRVRCQIPHTGGLEQGGGPLGGPEPLAVVLEVGAQVRNERVVLDAQLVGVAQMLDAMQRVRAALRAQHALVADVSTRAGGGGCGGAIRARHRSGGEVKRIQQRSR